MIFHDAEYMKKIKEYESYMKESQKQRKKRKGSWRNIETQEVERSDRARSLVMQRVDDDREEDRRMRQDGKDEDEKRNVKTNVEEATSANIPANVQLVYA